MKQVNLRDLPEPPSGKAGWPWTDETPQRLTVAAPTISIVVPNFNGAEFIEETIRSILLQAYSSLELIVVDGGSTDSSMDILNKYAHWIDYLISEPDEGQADAILKGLEYCSGEVFNWINSDDVLCRGALQEVADAWIGSTAVVGNVLNFSKSEESLAVNKELNLSSLLRGNGGFSFHQPGVFLKTEAARAIGFPSTLQYCFDLYLILGYFEAFGPPRYIERTLVKFRLHPQSKTSSNDIGFRLERIEVLELLSRLPSFKSYKNQLEREIETRKLQFEIDRALEMHAEDRILRILGLVGRYKSSWFSRYWLSALARAVFMKVRRF